MFLTQSDKILASLTCIMAFLAHFFAQFFYLKNMTTQNKMLLEGLVVSGLLGLPSHKY